jgi:hypothetical protein
MKFKKALLASASILFCVAALAQNLPSPSYKNLSVNGLTTISDTGRSGNDNTPSINLNASEALNYTASYATHYGFNLSATQLSGGTGDRIGLGVTQTCNATLSGKSCVGEAPLAVAAGTAVGNYTGSNPRVLVPASLTGPVGAAVGQEIDAETHSPVLIKNLLRLSDENLSGGTTTHGSVEDAMIALVNDSQNALQGFHVGIQFGENPQGYPLSWPILAGGTLFQASNPNVELAYGFDLSGSTAGFSKYAIALPQNVTGNGITWGTAGTAGNIASTATTNGGSIAFSDSGISMNNPSGGVVLNVGGSTGADVINEGYMTEYSLTGYVQCAGSTGRCTASTTIPIASGGTNATTASAALTNLGGLATTGGTLSGPLAVTGGSTSSVNLTGSTASGSYVGGAGSIYSFYPTIGYNTGDHQRAQQYISFNSAQDATISETGISINATMNTGLAKAWAQNTVYATGVEIDTAGNVYKATTGGTSATSGSGPSGTGSSISDGSVTWAYQCVDQCNAKMPLFVSAVAGPNAGKVWAGDVALTLQSGWAGGFAPAFEIDMTNNSGSNCATCQNLFISGNAGTNTIGAAASVYTPSTTNYQWVNGYQITGSKSVSNASFSDAASGTYSYQDTGSHTYGMYLNGIYGTGALWANQAITMQYDYARLNLFPASTSNKNQWRIISNANGSSSGSLAIQTTTDGFASSFITPATFGTNGSLTTNALAATSVSHSAQEIDKSYAYTSPSNGATVSFASTQGTQLIDPAGALTSLTVTLPACNSADDAFIARFSTTQALSGLTVNASSGAVANAPTSMTAGQGHGYICDGSRGAWYPLY